MSVIPEIRYFILYLLGREEFGMSEKFVYVKDSGESLFREQFLKFLKFWDRTYRILQNKVARCRQNSFSLFVSFLPLYAQSKTISE